MKRSDEHFFIVVLSCFLSCMLVPCQCVLPLPSPCPCVQSRVHSERGGSSHGSSKDLLQCMTAKESFNLHLEIVKQKI